MKKLILLASLALSCGGATSNLASCVHNALDGLPLDPNQATVGQLREAFEALQACHNPPADAGATH